MAASPATGGARSCETAEQTREWMEAIASFLGRHRPLLEAHVVNFFKDRLWEMVDADWMECLRREPVESLLMLPSGCVQDHWPSSLQEFILTARSLVLPREQKSPQSFLPNSRVASIGTVLAQGMNSKKKHEIEALSGIVDAIARSRGAKTVVDVGSGQGYLAQALSFEYQLAVTAIDASSHHASVTNTRAERIKKHYAAKCVEKQQFKVPRTVTCHVLSSDTLAAVTLDACQDDHGEHITETNNCNQSIPQIEQPNHSIPQLVLAGLHACGDLSVNMLRVFVSCEQVQALVSVGCCYNLLSEDTDTCPGFPISKAAKSSKLVLGKSIRDLACQSAERWRNLTKEMALQNFDIHAFRAAFQMVLEKYFPEVSRLSPSIGRQGKALRRQRLRKVMESHSAMGKADDLSYPNCKEQNMNTDGSLPTEPTAPKGAVECCSNELCTGDTYSTSAVVGSSISRVNVGPSDTNLDECCKFTLFKDFTISGLGRLGCGFVEDVNLLEIWKDVQHFTEFIGPFWCLRAALGPLVETYILLDRLLFLQEQGSAVEASLFPLFDPAMSPRNMALVAWKLTGDPLEPSHDMGMYKRFPSSSVPLSNKC
ncbi:protein RRNAD1-like isoform X1 [Triticum dicoccoides]|uniref:protein RRNAD1-like isoform X1 n=1 Tax=Triticum dicoccoides TaxID=85692 RepID=UPI00188FD3E1|nr:protein RRNAD1-like isoform X1 [Triticum dicoccoides]